MILKAVKKPIEIECVEWTGSNIDEVMEFCDDAYVSDGVLYIPTLEVDHKAELGSFIAKGFAGEFYIINGDDFRKNYDCREFI